MKSLANSPINKMVVKQKDLERNWLTYQSEIESFSSTKQHQLICEQKQKSILQVILKSHQWKFLGVEKENGQTKFCFTNHRGNYVVLQTKEINAEPTELVDELTLTEWGKQIFSTVNNWTVNFGNQVYRNKIWEHNFCRSEINQLKLVKWIRR